MSRVEVVVMGLTEMGVVLAVDDEKVLLGVSHEVDVQGGGAHDGCDSAAHDEQGVAELDFGFMKLDLE